MIGAPLLAALTLAALRDYRALAVAAGVTVLAYAIDVVAGSPLTSLSLLGPNPGLGVRFYGIGNELEALLAVLVVAGIGAALAGFAPARPRARPPPPSSASACSPLVFAAGSFGADVGAAIVFPVGAAVAAVAVAGGRRCGRPAGDRDPLRDAGPAGADRPALAAPTRTSPARSSTPAACTRSARSRSGGCSSRSAASAALSCSSSCPSSRSSRRWRSGAATLAAWLGRQPAMRAGLLGALVATAVGTLANDSGALLLVIGAAYLLAFAAYAWATESVNRVASGVEDRRGTAESPPQVRPRKRGRSSTLNSLCA